MEPDDRGEDFRIKVRWYDDSLPDEQLTDCRAERGAKNHLDRRRGVEDDQSSQPASRLASRT